MKKYYIGFDVGGTKCAVSLAAVEGENIRILNKEKFPTVKNEPDTVLDQFAQVLDWVLENAQLSYSDIEAIGISCGGPLDSVRGIVQSPPNLPGWDDIAIVDYFQKRTGIRAALQNDANACAVAEWKFGAGRGTQNMVFLTFGTGLGAGLILNGALYSGTSDMAGEIGHVRLARRGPVGYGKEGSAEGFCSGGGIAQLGIMAVDRELAKGNTPRLLQRAGGRENITAKLIAELAINENDALCKKIYRECGRRLGETLSILIDLLNPERIILGGVYMRAEALIVPSMRKVLDKETIPYAENVCEILPAGLGESIGDYAAIAVATMV